MPRYIPDPIANLPATAATLNQVPKADANGDYAPGTVTGGSGVSDGDYGDITVSGGGTTWTIDAGVVTTTELGGDITTAGKALLDDADNAAQRATLGLGTLATQNGTFSGTSSGTNTGDNVGRYALVALGYANPTLTTGGF